MANPRQYEEEMAKLTKDGRITDLILKEIENLSQRDKVKLVCKIYYLQKIPWLKAILSSDKEYREQLTLAYEIISPLSRFIETELFGHHNCHISLNGDLSSPSLSPMPNKPDSPINDSNISSEKLEDISEFMSNFDNWN